MSPSKFATLALSSLALTTDASALRGLQPSAWDSVEWGIEPQDTGLDWGLPADHGHQHAERPQPPRQQSPRGGRRGRHGSSQGHRGPNAAGPTASSSHNNRNNGRSNSNGNRNGNSNHFVGQAIIQAYPGYTGSNIPSGVVKVFSGGHHSPGTKYEFALNLAEADATGGWHVHTGYTCEDASLVGGHLYCATGAEAGCNGVAAAADPWLSSVTAEATWSSDGTGFAQGGIGGGTAVAQDAFLSASNVLGRAVVVHDSSGARVGCGTIQGARQKVGTAHIGAYPGLDTTGATGTVAPAGKVDVYQTAAGGTEYEYELLMIGTADEAASSAGGWHVHAGTSCADAALVGGHYWGHGVDTAASADPWIGVVWTTGGDGEATSAWEAASARAALAGIEWNSDLNGASVSGHAIVVHDSTGARVGCGTIQ